PKHLPKSLILPEVKRLSTAVIDSRKHHRPAVGRAKFVPHERRNTPLVDSALVIEEILRIECSIPRKFKRASVHSACAGLCDYVRKARRTVPNVCRHHAGARLYFLNRIHVEIRNSGAAEFRVRRISAVHREDGSRAALAVNGKLLCEIRG